MKKIKKAGNIKNKQISHFPILSNFSVVIYNNGEFNN